MGSGTYSVVNSTTRSNTSYKNASTAQIFESRMLESEMNPKGTIRECCDSDEHPNTVPIVIALDVTGSMGMVPTNFIKEGMTTIMGTLYAAGLKDSQLLFMGVGDHYTDDAPLQVGQFESDDELLDKWLKKIYLESGGGGNGGESYMLPWKYAATYIKMDAFDKRGVKGYLFTIGDEPVHKTLEAGAIKQIFGDGDSSAVQTAELLSIAREKFNVFHINIKETSNGASSATQNCWKDLLGDDCLMVDSYKNIPNVIADKVKLGGVNTVVSSHRKEGSVKTGSEEMML